MNEALTRIFTLQQQEINEEARRKQVARIKHDREVAAFQNSGLPELFRNLAGVPLREAVRQRIYRQDFSQVTWDHCNPCTYTRVKEIVCVSGTGGDRGLRWRCEEQADSGRIKYVYTDGQHGGITEMYDTPNGPWLDRFIEYAARLCDPEAIAKKLNTTLAEPAGGQPRRKLQAV